MSRKTTKCNRKNITEIIKRFFFFNPEPAPSP